MEDQHPGNVCFVLYVKITGSLYCFIFSLDFVCELREDLFSCAHDIWNIGAAAASLVSHTARRNPEDVPSGQSVQPDRSQREYRFLLSSEPVLEAG